MIYKSYILKNSFLNWLATSFILIILIWFSRAIAFLSLVTENGINIKDFLYLFILILPWILIYILPISFLISLILSLNKLIVSNEIIILKNCGLSNFKIAKPIISLGIFITIIVYFLSFYLMPLANKKLKISKNAFKDNYTNISFAPQTFENFNNITIYSATRDENNNLQGLFISDKNNSEYNIIITAETGKLIINDDRVYLKLSNGTLQRYNYNDSKTDILNFDSYIFNLNNNNLEYSNYKWKPNERFINELLSYNINDSEDDIRLYKAELHKRINEPLIPLVLSLISISIILSAKISRKSNFLTLFKAIFFSIFFVVSLIISFRMNDRNESWYFFSYLINITFIAFSLILIKHKNFSIN